MEGVEWERRKKTAKTARTPFAALRTPHSPPGRPDMNVKAIVDRVMDPYGEYEQKRREERDRNGI